MVLSSSGNAASTWAKVVGLLMVLRLLGNQWLVPQGPSTGMFEQIEPVKFERLETRLA